MFLEGGERQQGSQEGRQVSPDGKVGGEESSWWQVPCGKQQSSISALPPYLWHATTRAPNRGGKES